MSDRPPRLSRIFEVYGTPLYFVTFNTHNRRPLVANAAIHLRFIEFARGAEERGIAVGQYIILPDHIHLFVRGNADFVLTDWVRLLKRRLSKALEISLPHWQEGFFDHIIRNSESYAEKWHYVRENPVRHGLVAQADDWPWQGEVVVIERP